MHKNLLIYLAEKGAANKQIELSTIQISKEIDSKGIEIIESGFDRIPMDTKELNESDQADVDRLLERLEEDDDVQTVYHNMA